ncbi:alpha/beta fold hydrolase [Streptomyces nigra]|uniref:alpha/beta fold hydrolase n=1 Tax=Streptomyces nigra TaxID=1827580 RepID=UPI003686577F
MYAVDLMGDAGRTEPGRVPFKNAGDLTTWLDSLLDGLGLARTDLCGHSYGAWIAVTWAARPHRRIAT